MILEPGLIGGPGFEPALCAIYSPFVDLKVHGGLYLVCLTLHVREACGSFRVRSDTCPSGMSSLLWGGGGGFEIIGWGSPCGSVYLGYNCIFVIW